MPKIGGTQKPGSLGGNIKLISSMKNAILLHGRFSEKIDGKPVADIPECNPNNENNWMGWTKKELEKHGYHVVCPIVPKVWEATYSEWKKTLDTIGINSETILIGLSAGAGACVRYIIEENKNIEKLILIAPARHASQDSPDQTFYDFTITNDTRKQIRKGTTIFVSNDDWPGIIESAKMYEKELEAKVVWLKGRGHFSFLIKTFPELLEEILISRII